jgi:hypothetical protein
MNNGHHRKASLQQSRQSVRIGVALGRGCLSSWPSSMATSCSVPRTARLLEQTQEHVRDLNGALGR